MAKAKTRKAGYSARDLKEVANNPVWTKDDFARANPFAEVLPDLAKTIRRRGPQKSPTKQLVSLRLSREVIDHFKKGGPGWQGRIDAALKNVAKAK